MDTIRKIGVFLEKTGDIFIRIIVFPLFVGLVYYSMRYTEVLKPMTEIPLTIVDSTVKNVIVFVSVIFVFFCLRTILLKKSGFDWNKFNRYLIAGTAVLVALVSIWWVSICHVQPRADCSTLCMIAQLFLDSDNFSFMRAPGYMAYCPHQYGLLSVIQLLFTIFGDENYQAFQYMNALCMPLLFYSGYKLLHLIWNKKEVALYYCALFVSFLPIFLYVPYVYGEVTCTTFTMVFMWQVVRWCKTGKKSCFVWGTLAIAFACIMRTNSWIVLIAAGIVLIIYALRNQKWQSVVWLITMVLVAVGVNAGIRTGYETVYGHKIPGGIPSVAYMLMGLEDGEDGPGWFNGTNYNMYGGYDHDTKIAADESVILIKKRLEEFGNDKGYTIDFFRRKILSQWNSPTYHSIFETTSFDCEKEELPGVVRWLYYDKVSAIREFMNRYQFVLYIGVAITAGVTLFRKKETIALENHILFIAIIGGFLFSIIWEAMSRYVISYVTYMIPLAAVGMWQLQEGISFIIKKYIKKDK